MSASEPRELLFRGVYSDLILRVGGHDIKCHRSFVCVASPMIKQRYEQATAEQESSNHGIVTLVLHDVDADTISRVLEHVYTGNYPSSGPSLHFQNGRDNALTTSTRANITNAFIQTSQDSSDFTKSRLPFSMPPAPPRRTAPNIFSTYTRLQGTATPSAKSLRDLSLELVIDVEVYLCAKALGFRAVQDAAASNFKYGVDDLFKDAFNVQHLVAPFKELFESTSVGEDQLRRTISQRCLINHQKCDENQSMQDLLMQHEENLWTVAVPVLRDTHREVTVVCTNCDTWANITTSAKSGPVLTTDFKMRCMQCENSSKAPRPDLFGSVKPAVAGDRPANTEAFSIPPTFGERNLSASTGGGLSGGVNGPNGGGLFDGRNGQNGGGVLNFTRSAPPTADRGGNLFGTSTFDQTPLASSATSAAGNPSGGAFGSGLFNSTSTQQPSNSLFGNTPTVGTKGYPFSNAATPKAPVTTFFRFVATPEYLAGGHCEVYQSINMMDCYRQWSFEELRLADYRSEGLCG